MSWHRETDEQPFLLKAVVLGLVAVFAVIGVIGLVLPIIPGILFLGLAALLLARVSRRFADYLEAQPLWQKARRRWHSTRTLSPLERIKLSAWYAASSLVAGVERLLTILLQRAS